MATSLERRRAQIKAAQARYRIRKRAEAKGEAIPPAAANRRHSPEVAKAYAAASAARARRIAVIESLPDIRNPRLTLYVSRDPVRGRGDGVLPYKATRGGQQRQAESIVENEKAKGIRALGKSRRQQLVDELHNSKNSERLQTNMNAQQQARFQQLSERIASYSQQSLGILFSYADGAGEYSGVIEAILASPESRDVELGLARLALLAKRAKQANEFYSVRNVGPITA